MQGLTTRPRVFFLLFCLALPCPRVSTRFVWGRSRIIVSAVAASGLCSFACSIFSVAPRCLTYLAALALQSLALLIGAPCHCLFAWWQRNYIIGSDVPICVRNKHCPGQCRACCGARPCLISASLVWKANDNIHLHCRGTHLFSSYVCQDSLHARLAEHRAQVCEKR